MKSLKNKEVETWLKEFKQRNLQIMQNRAEKVLNANHYQLSSEAKKRLRWLYFLYYEQGGKVTQTSLKLGITRQWLSAIKKTFERNGKDPRSLEPHSRAPHNTKNRKRISSEIEEKIIEVRDKSKGVWGKQKIAVVLLRDHRITVNPNTINKYLHKHKRIDPKISLKNTKAWKEKDKREKPDVELRVKYRPPRALKDLAPGALVEKDMKYVPKREQEAGSSFYYQHTEACSFTRIRSLELTKDSTANSSRLAHIKSIEKFPFDVACENTDNGTENHGELREQFKKEDTFHFFSNSGTPTDNPRVERSHLTDENEFYQKGGIKSSFIEQKNALEEWEYTYNFVRPHQALGYLTPMEFHALWKKSPESAFVIVNMYQLYLKKQSKRLEGARRIKKKEEIEKLMEFIDAKLNKKVGIRKAKQALVNCKLCSLA